MAIATVVLKRDEVKTLVVKVRQHVDEAWCVSEEGDHRKLELSDGDLLEHALGSVHDGELVPLDVNLEVHPPTGRRNVFPQRVERHGAHTLPTCARGGGKCLNKSRPGCKNRARDHVVRHIHPDVFSASRQGQTMAVPRGVGLRSCRERGKALAYRLERDDPTAETKPPKPLRELAFVRPYVDEDIGIAKERASSLGRRHRHVADRRILVGRFPTTEGASDIVASRLACHDGRANGANGNEGVTRTPPLGPRPQTALDASSLGSRRAALRDSRPRDRRRRSAVAIPAAAWRRMPDGRGHSGPRPSAPHTPDRYRPPMTTNGTPRPVDRTCWRRPMPVPLTIVMPSTLQQEREFRLAIGRVPYCNIPLAVRVTGSLRVDLGEQALHSFLSRHDAFRTTLTERHGAVVQVIRPSLGVSLDRVDLSECGARRGRLIATHVLQALNQPFDLSRPPLARAQLLSLGPTDHVLAIVVPHTIADLRSRAIFVREFSALYDALANSKPPRLESAPAQLRDVADWERHADHGRSLTYWRGVLSGLDRTSVRPLTGIETQALPVTEVQESMPSTSRSLTQAIHRVAEERGAHPALVLVALVAAVQRLHSRSDVTVVGLMHANRLRPTLRGVVGSLADCVPLVLHVPSDISFAELVDQVTVALHLAEAHPAPWSLIRDLLPGPMDAVVNYIRDVPAPPALTGLARHAQIRNYTPTHRSFGCFPVKEHWIGSRICVEAEFHRDGTTSNTVSYFPPALNSVQARDLHRQITETARRAVRRPTASLGVLAGECARDIGKRR